MRLNELTIMLIFSLLAIFPLVSCQNEAAIPDVYTPINIDGVASNKIVFWGHSAGRIVEPFIEEEINDISSSFNFEKCSVDGEKMLQIAARQGSIPAYFHRENCERPGRKFMIANEEHPLASGFDGSAIPFSIVNGVNPCTINNVTGKITRVKKNFYFQPNDVDYFSLDSVNYIYTSAAIEFRYPFFTFFWCDQLVDRNNVETLLEKYRIMVDFTGNDRFLIIGSIRGDTISHKEVESKLSVAFAGHYFNAREYLVSEAIKDYSSFSASDRDLINIGSVPTVWMKDEVHLNNKGASLVAKEAMRLFEAQFLQVEQ